MEEQNSKNFRLWMSYSAFFVAYFGLILTNKALADRLVDDNWAIVACVLLQAVISVMCLYSVSAVGFSPPIRRLSRRKLKKLVFAPLLFTLMLLSSIESMKYVSIPTMNAFRNFSIFFTAIGEWIIFGIPLSMELIVVLILMFLSAIIGGYGEVGLTGFGFLWVSINCLSSAGYLLNLRIIMKKTKITNLALAYYNNTLSIPLLLPIFIYFRFTEVETGLNLVYIPISIPFCLLIFLNALCAFGMTISSFWALRSSSATTFSVTRALSKIPLSIIGLYIFPTPVSTLTQVSITLALFAAVLFAYFKHVQNSNRNTPNVLLPVTIEDDASCN